MSKKIDNFVLADFIAAVCSIHWFQGDQIDERADSIGNPLAEIVPLYAVHNGWKDKEPGPHAYELTKEQINRAIAERAQFLLNFEQGYIDYGNGVRISVPENVPLVYRDNDGNIIPNKPAEGEGTTETLTRLEIAAHIRERVWNQPPKFGGNSTYRRGSVIAVGAVAVFKATGKWSFTTLPATGRKYATDEARLLDRLRENDQRGRRAYGNVGLAAIACKLVSRFHYTEAQLGRHLNIARGTQQQLYAFALLNSQHPKLRLLERVTMPRPVGDDNKLLPIKYVPGGHIPFSRLHKESLSVLVGKGEGTGEPAALAKSVMPNWHSKQRATGDQVESYLRKAIDEKLSTGKTIGRPELETAIATVPADVTGPALVALQTVQAILAGDSPMLSTLLAGKTVHASKPATTDDSESSVGAKQPVTSKRRSGKAGRKAGRKAGK